MTNEKNVSGQPVTLPTNRVAWMALRAGQLTATQWFTRCVRLALATRKANGRCARYAVTLGGRSSLVQFLDALYVAVKYDLAPDDYYRYELYIAEKRRDAAYYIPSRVHRKFRRRLFSKLQIATDCLADKRRFADRCRQHGIAVVPTVAEFESGRMVFAGGLVALPREDLFSKEACGGRGRGAMLWTYTGNATWQAGDEPPFSESDLLETLTQFSRGAPVILQPRIRNHPAIAPLSSGALCTARIMTCRAYDKTPEVIGAVFRAPVEHRSVDNYTQGGLASGVDTNGVLGPAVSKKLPDGMRRLACHPVTGARITGMQLPFWPEAKQIAVAAHALYPEFPSIGWDVALTPDAPVMIEGNVGWGVRLPQFGQPLGRTRLTECYASWIEHASV